MWRELVSHHPLDCIQILQDGVAGVTPFIAETVHHPLSGGVTYFRQAKVSDRVSIRSSFLLQYFLVQIKARSCPILPVHTALQGGTPSKLGQSQAWCGWASGHIATWAATGVLSLRLASYKSCMLETHYLYPV